MCTLGLRGTTAAEGVNFFLSTKTHVIAILLILVSIIWIVSFENKPAADLDSLVAMVSSNEPTPRGFSPSINDRSFWEQKVKELSIEKLPPPTSSASTSTTRQIIAIGTQQECCFNTGEWLPAIEAEIQRTLDSPWGTVDMDKLPVLLPEVTVAYTLAACSSLLRDKLSAETQARIASEIKRRIIIPFLLQTEKYKKTPLSWGRDNCPWLEKPTNWTAFCISWILYSTLATQDDPLLRAKVIEQCMYFSIDYMGILADDGYVASGARYWRYAFPPLITFAERLAKISNGKIDLFTDKKFAEVAAFMDRIELSRVKTHETGIDSLYYPLFADNKSPLLDGMAIREIVSRRFGIYDITIDSPPHVSKFQNFIQNITHTPYPTNYKKIAAKQTVNLGLWDFIMNPPNVGTFPMPPVIFNRETGRYFFESSGCLIAKSGNISLACNGGGNYEDHNHNDAGSYTIVINNKHIMGDPGTDTYTDVYFHDISRYSFPGASSSSHPVPTVNNGLQQSVVGRGSLLIDKAFSKEKDSVTYDLTPAYDCPSLEKLMRSIVLIRGANPKVVITDSFTAKAPVVFASPIVLDPDAKGLHVLLSQNPQFATATFKMADDVFTVSVNSSDPISIVKETTTVDNITRLAPSFSINARFGYIQYEIGLPTSNPSQNTSSK